IISQGHKQLQAFVDINDTVTISGETISNGSLFKSQSRHVECLNHASGGRTGRRTGAATHAALGKSSPEFVVIGPGVVDLVRLDNSVSCLEEVRVGGTKLHSFGDKLEDQFVANGITPLLDEIGAGFPKCDAPNLSLIVDFVGVHG